MKTSFDEFSIFYLLYCEINIQNYHSSIVIGYNLVDLASTNYKNVNRNWSKILDKLETGFIVSDNSYKGNKVLAIY